jgi:hypothetical protein
MNAGINIEYSPTAFKHGITEDAIAHAISTKVHDSLIVGHPEKYLAIGFDSTGNLIEMIYNVVDDTTIQVFHAMKCRKVFLAKLGF